MVAWVRNVENAARDYRCPRGWTAENDMVRKEVFRQHGSGCEVTVEAVPGAKRTELSGINEWRSSLGIRLAAPASEGMANEALVEFLASILSVPSGSVRIIRGQRSRLKTVVLPVSPEVARSKLGDG